MKTTKLEIKKLGINGEGIGYINRKITFVRGTLPGEEVEVEIVNETKNFKEGKLVKILKKSPHRQESPCVLSEYCLGCPLLHYDYEQQLYYKRDIIRDSIHRYTNIDLKRCEFRKTIPAKELMGYKTTVYLPIVSFHQRVQFGIYQRESKYLTLMNKCRMQHPLINRCLLQLEDILNEHKVRVYNEDTRLGLRFLTVRLFDEGLQLIFVTGRDRLDYRLIEAIEQIEGVQSIYYTINTTKDQDFTRGRYEKVSGSTRQEFKLLNQKYIISPKSEYPVNSGMVETTVNYALNLLSKNVNSVLEVNCGIGWLSTQLPEHVTVYGIDYNRSNIDDAKLNAKFLRKDNCHYESGKIDELVTKLNKNKSFDAFIIHSPHLGMRKSVKESLIRGKIKEVIYISSSPSSLAKDLGELERYYRVESIIPIDDMPNSQNVKVIVKLGWR